MGPIKTISSILGIQGPSTQIGKSRAQESLKNIQFRQCMSPGCYAEVYCSDPLEEGEIDVRKNSFKEQNNKEKKFFDKNLFCLKLAKIAM